MNKATNVEAAKEPTQESVAAQLQGLSERMARRMVKMAEDADEAKRLVCKAAKDGFADDADVALATRLFSAVLFAQAVGLEAGGKLKAFISRLSGGT